MSSKRFLSPWKNSSEKPVIYHCVSRVVDRRFVLKEEEREKFRMFMRMVENFSGCRVLSYCLMSNHFHILLEVPPAPAEGVSDGEILRRLGAIYSEAAVAAIAREMEEARAEGAEALLGEIRLRHTRRMHDLSEFMKALLIRFTRWFNRTHQRTGTLWEDRFKSVIVESGLAARTMAAYIDLNPVRAGMVEDPAEYRWSSYGEAVGGGKKGNGKKAREGLVRANRCDKGVGFDATQWLEVAKSYRILLGMAVARKRGKAKLEEMMGKGKAPGKAAEMRNMNMAETIAHLEKTGQTIGLPDLTAAKILRMRVRYFTDGAVIGSKAFVNEAFAGARERFSDRRKDGARRMRGSGAAAKGVLWSIRDLRVGVGIEDLQRSS
jgi:REP element-mobilizing transposase RayT